MLDFAKNNLGRFASFWLDRAQKKAPIVKNRVFGKIPRVNELKEQIRKSQKFHINLQVEAFWQKVPELYDEMVHCLVSVTS